MDIPIGLMKVVFIQEMSLLVLLRKPYRILKYFCLYPLQIPINQNGPIMRLQLQNCSKRKPFLLKWINGSKGLLTVNAGIDTDKEPLARQEIFAQLEACQQGDFTDEELNAAKAAILSGLRGVTDSPGAIENYYGTAVLSGLAMTVSEYMAAVESVTAEQVITAAKTVRYHSSFFLKGVTA